ncbi:MAG TPA: STAS domain-containing protein [Vicinamibacteria bacterium]|jgi:anti-sigma B factor antagonist
MQIEVTEADGATVVKPGGERLDIEVAGEFRTALHGLIKGGRQNLVIDLGDVSFIDSSGLGALVSALKMVKTSKDRRRGPRPGAVRRPPQRGDIRLANVQPPVVALLEIIRLHRVFSSYLSVEDAVQSYA